ncbi:hypothetical protein EXIGLDRAFT_735232 [Exidia glandulosa HHB12029]|uniref:Uncharacterized protein n=1 Tax=Exidia glandulosa HHB12029 TaxID=1314781 RepID=A0A165ASQ1_EXIGL|nr:hypothetical protein EXIGLDRAFT_735232 [Exidia glandulosa HHB12029]
MDNIFDDNFDIFSQLDAPVVSEPQSLSTQTTLDSSFDALLAELGLSPSAELASGLTSPTSSTASSVPPETPAVQVAALPPVSVVVTTDTGKIGKSTDTAIDVDVVQVEQPKMAPVSSSAQLVAQPVQYDPRMLAMAHHQRILQTQRVMHAQACTDLQRVAAYYTQFGVHVPLLKPVLMPYAPATNPMPTPASKSTERKSTKDAKGPVRTASKAARAAPYPKPAVAQFPFNAETQADAEILYQRRIAKERRRKEELARAPKRVGVPSVMRLPAPNPSRV